ncbi:uncharacterized protein LOC115218075 [Octopus sinensis]|uniref:Uncharacterized protein LOC115218075 n=1 Tax=Octopus sinensis TaxID=2607531 RepID=A0A6P7SZ80_9MOLL|nr:uncharacterized protein LOC115218075 [Octopus sinensis]
MYLHLHRSSNLLLCSLFLLMCVRTSYLMNYPIYPCTSNEPTKWVRHSENCNKFYFCFFGQPIPMPECPSHHVWSMASSTCVHVNSSFDDCQQMPIKKNLSCSNYNGLIPYNENCNWYYNCSSDDPDLIRKCPFPQLFNDVQLKCDDIPNVNCGNRFEPFDRCDYSGYSCQRAHCIPCIRDSSCLGQPDGNYTRERTFPSGSYITCYLERLIAYHSCSGQLLFSPSENKCVSFFNLRKEEGGMRPDCRFRADGYYPDEIGRCDHYFQCNNTKFQGHSSCSSGMTFNPVLKTCQSQDQVSPPCGVGNPPSCVGRQDGLYADLDGRCTYYFVCNQSAFQEFHTCSTEQAFNPYLHSCVKGIESQIKPCGIQDNPCKNRSTGFYLHNSSSSQYYECHQGLFIYFGTCPKGQTFSISSKLCENLCVNKKDGRYKSPEAECFGFYECSQQKFLGLTQCTNQLNGTRFNSLNGTCDQPQNVCPPCGTKSFDCPSYYESTTSFI